MFTMDVEEFEFKLMLIFSNDISTFEIRKC